MGVTVLGIQRVGAVPKIGKHHSAPVPADEDETAFFFPNAVEFVNALRLPFGGSSDQAGIPVNQRADGSQYEPRLQQRFEKLFTSFA